MQDPANQATAIIDLWPGDSRPDRRRSMAESLPCDEEKVRYWEKKGEIPLREWQGILDAAARLNIPITRMSFVRHLKDPAETAASASVVA